MSKMSFDEALGIFLDKFIELHQKGTLPRWFKNCTTYGGTKDNNKCWRLAFTAVPKYLLKENECWDTASDGRRALVEIDPVSGEKKYIISNTATEVITLFEVVVNPLTSAISIVTDLDLSSIDGEELQELR